MRTSRNFVVALFSIGLAIAAFAGWSPAQAQAQTFQHPGILVSQAQLNYMKAMVQAHQEPFYTAFLKAQASTWGSLTYLPYGPPVGGVIQCGATSNPNYGCSSSDSDSTAAYLQSLLWYITGNQTYANNAINIMNLYATTLKGYAGYTPGDPCPTGTDCSNGPLQSAWDSQKWPRAAEIIRYSNAGWSSAQATAFGQMLTTYMLPQLINGSSSNGNWEISMIEGMVGIGIYNNDVTTYNTAISYWKQRLPAYFYSYTDGSTPVRAPRGSANWYGQTVYDPTMNGISQETCRDFGHAQYGSSGSLDVAETALIQGTNLYQDLEQLSDSAQGTYMVNAQNRLTSVLEFNSYYLLRNPVPSTLCDDASADQSVANNTISLVNYPTNEIGYNEYHNRLGISLPNTLNYLNTTIRQLPAQNMTESHIMVWETLTHGGDASQMQPFLMWTSATSATLQSGSSSSYTVTVVPGSASNLAVTLSVSGLPAGVSYTFSPATVTGSGTSTLTINATSSTIPGSYPLTITGASGSTTATNALSLLVNSPTANFALSSNPVVVSSVAGDVATFPITLTLISSYMGSVTLSATGMPTGATAAFSNAAVTNIAPNSTLTVTTQGITAPGAYNIVISGTDGVLTNSTQVELIVGAINNACIQQMGYSWITGSLAPQTGTFTAQWDATPSTALNNSNVGLSNVNMLSFDGPTTYTDLDLAARFNPTGDIDARNGSAFVALSTIPYTAGTTYHFRTLVNVPASTYSIYVTPPGQSEIAIGTNYTFRAGAAVGTPPSLNYWNAISQVGSIALCNLQVGTPDFAPSVTPNTQTVLAGKSAVYTATIAPIASYAGNVTLTATGMPSGATASFYPAQVAVGTGSVTSTLTIATTGTTATGVYPITITATDGTLTHTAATELMVNPPCLSPKATSQTNVSVAENSAVAITLAGTLGAGCPSTDTLTAAVTTNPTHGVLTGTVSNLMYTPTAGYAGSDSLSFTVTDSNALTPASSAASVTILVAAPISGAPIMGSLSPAVVVAGSSPITLTVSGSGFTAASTVIWNGASRTTVFVSATQLTVALAASDLSASGIVSVTVSNPGTTGGVSTPLMLAIDSSIQISLLAQTTSYTVARGQSATVQLQVANLPTGMETSATCYDMPAGINCSYNAQAETITFTTGLNTPAGTYQLLVVSTVSPATKASTMAHTRGTTALCGLLGLPLGWIWFGSKRKRWLYPAVGLCGVLLLLFVGCTSSKTATPSAASQASTALTLTIN